ncbi:MAG TPA: hypothetical protein VHM89_05870 [Acidimicrobiales bacterium]|nr:hypothetical protein [Acidimicrobiales bacterium]
MSRRRWAAAVVATLAVASCGRNDPLPASPQVVDVTMGEYGFSYDHSVSAGRAVFRAANTGALPHELVLVVVPKELAGHLAAQLQSSKRKAVATRGYLPPRPPGADGTFAVDLRPAHYALMCFVTDPDGEVHARKGMVSEFTVR